jgi:putative ABC transport system permease protein
VRAALDDVDPDGRTVTPVVRVLPPGSETGGTLAVVPDAFRTIALFPGGTSPAPVWARLRAPDAKPILVTGTRISLDVNNSTLSSTRTDRQSNPVTLGLDLVVVASGETLHTTLGALDGPTDHARLATNVSCGGGCYVTAVWARTLPGATIDGRATLRNLVGDPGGGAAALGPEGRWTPYDDPDVGTFQPHSTSRDRLDIEVHSGGAALISMTQTWLPSSAEALVSGPLPPGSRGGRLTILGLDGEDQDAVRAGDLPRVPGSRPDTTVVNLDVVQRGRSIAADASVELWFADDDPALLDRVSDALADHGATLSGSSTLADARRTYDESAAAWSLQLSVLVGGAALLIALLVLLVSAVSSWRFRTRDFAALRMSGIPRRSIRAMAVAGQLPAVLVGIVAGTASGLLGAHLALPIVPLFASAPEVSTLDLRTAWGGVAAAAAAALVVLGLGSVLIGRELARRSDLRRLRETL